MMLYQVCKWLETRAQLDGWENHYQHDKALAQQFHRAKQSLDQQMLTRLDAWFEIRNSLEIPVQYD